MTLKSTTAFIQSLAVDDSFEKWLPLGADVDERKTRCVILHKSVADMIRIEGGSMDDSMRIEINMQLGHFVRGSRITVLAAPNPPKKPAKAHSDIRGLMGYDYLLWEYKVRKPMQYRLIGVVPEKDTFVGFSLISRDSLANGWKVPCNEVLDHYKEVLGGSECLSVKSDNPEEAFSEWRIPK